MFVIAKRTVEGKDMVYLSLQLPREMWVLMELKVTPGVPFPTYSVGVDILFCVVGFVSGSSKMFWCYYSVRSTTL